MGFAEMTGDSNIYRKLFSINGRQEELVIGQYVDDSIILASSPEAQQWLMERLSKRFPVNPNSSGSINFSEPGLSLSMNVRYDIERGILQKAVTLELRTKGITQIDLKYTAHLTATEKNQKSQRFRNIARSTRQSSL